MRTQFKVYIIDEVHMLTKEAFNALLKTLEEPPPNVKFVFCTTEPNKVPDTILSRCQRFDFSSINDKSIGDRLREIAAAEGFEVSEDALELVARRARGSMRDSQSLFDQLLAFSDGTVSSDDVHRMLGTAGDDRLLELFDAIIEHRPGEVLSQLDTAFGLGVQPGELMDQCIGYVRDLMVTLSGGTDVGLCSVANRHREMLMKQASRLGMHSVMAAFQILSDSKNQMFRSTFARTVLEMGMVQLSLLENLTAISELLSGRLPALPELPAGTSGAGSSSTAGSTGAVVGEKKNSEGLISPPPRPVMPAIEMPNSVDDDGYEDPDDLRDDDDLSPSVSTSSMAAILASQSSELARAASTSTSTVAAAPVMQAAAVAVRAGHETPAVANSPRAAAAAAAPAPVDVETVAPKVQSSIRQSDCPRLFQELLKTVGLTISAGLKMATDLVLVGPNRLEIHLDSSYDFAKKVLDQPESRARIETEIQKLTGESMTVNLRLLATQRPAAVPVHEPVAVAEKPATSTASRGRQNESSGSASTLAKAGPKVVPQRNLLGEIDPARDPFVRQVMAIFAATVVKVTVAPSVQVAETEVAT